MDNINFTEAKFRQFKRAYEKIGDAPVFMWEGKPILKSYAKYLIEYLEGKFSGKTT